MHTYRDQRGEIHFLSAYLRIGRKDSFVDNAGKGGICVSLDKFGRCVGDTVFTTNFPNTQIIYTDNGIKIDGYQIEHFEEIINTAMNAHLRIYQFDLIGWDMAVDQDGNVLIIEFNPDPDLRIEQAIFHDTCLNDYQEDILKRLRNSK